jgi:Putative beta-lactamase-inhibitor-like, PepSY-like
MKNFILLGFVSALLVLVSCQKDSALIPTVDATTDVTTTNTATTTTANEPPAGGPAGVLGDTIPTSSIPDSVKRFILATYPGSTITVVEIEIRNGVTFYEVEILVNGVRKELYFSATWVYLNTRNGNCGSGGAGRDNHGGSNRGHGGGGRDSIYNVVIPAATLAQIKATYPADTVIVGKKEKRDSVTTYVVVIRNGSTVRFLKYDANWVFISISTGDGTHISSGNHGTIAVTDIPTAAKTYISTTYVGYTIVKAQSEVKRGVTTYEVQITNGTTKKWLVFSSAWIFLREEH